jgi:hypothetical protein
MPMLNLISLLIGLLAIFPILFALLPFFGWANWLLLPLPVVGLIIGSLSSSNAGRNLNLILLLVAIVRLWLGAGIF